MTLYFLWCSAQFPVLYSREKDRQKFVKVNGWLQSLSEERHRFSNESLSLRAQSQQFSSKITSLENYCQQLMKAVQAVYQAGTRYERPINDITSEFFSI